MHQDFASNDENFAGLDAVIQSGPDLTQFLNDTIRYHDEHAREALEERSVTSQSNVHHVLI